MIGEQATIREHLQDTRNEADCGRFIYATIDPEDAARIMDDCLERIQDAAVAALALMDEAEKYGYVGLRGEMHRLIPDPGAGSSLPCAPTTKETT